MSHSSENINPSFRKTQRKTKTLSQILDGLKNGDKLTLSYALSLAESLRPEDQKLVAQILSEHDAEKSRRIAITGPPGAGKSTLINAWGELLTSQNKKLAVLTIDPSSPESGGSILGDKTRMDELGQNESAFIRPSASGKESGGIASATMESILLCEMAGYENILVETVGVGQSEIAVAKMVDMYILLIQPGSGDELQGIKRGIMELADLFVVNKADGDNADLAKASAKALNVSKGLLQTKSHGIKADTIVLSALTNDNIYALSESVESFFQAIDSSQYKKENRKKQLSHWFEYMINKSIVEIVEEVGKIKEIKSSLRKQIVEEEKFPIEAIEDIKKTIREIIQKDN